MLTAHQLSKSYNTKNVLTDVSFNINAGERVGLIGPNGSGKTTLLRILIDQEYADTGHISLTPSNLKIGYLSQGFEPSSKDTIRSLIQKESKTPEALELELIRVSTALTKQPDNIELQIAYDQILSRMQQPSIIGHLSSILETLGLDHLPDDQFVSTLSGGQKTRLALALVLLSDPQLLLLDEPTNHLDIKMLEWLENWISKFSGAALIVSHDRAFLDRTVTRILDLNPHTHTIKSYAGNYTEYIETITREYERQKQSYNDQVAEIRRMKTDILRTRSQAERTEREASSIRIGGGMMKLKGYKDYQQGIAKKVARKAKSRQKKLKRYLESDERIEKPKTDWQIKLKFNTTKQLGKQVLKLDNLSVGYPGYPPLLTHVNITAPAGRRIAFTGPNGSGKTTLLRSIAGQITPLEGQVQLGSTVRLGYMSQEQDTLDQKLNAVETIQTIAQRNETEIRNFLHYFLLSGDDPLRPIELLSYGERSRLMLARLIAQGCNFLLLDEPVNHLDIPSREQFEQALTSFDGTVLAVVHDRYFISQFAEEVWIIENKNIKREIRKPIE